MTGAPRLEVAGQLAADLDPYTAASVALANGSAIDGAAPHEPIAPQGDVSPAGLATSGAPPSIADPDHCDVHGDRLVTAGQAGVRTYAGRDPNRIYCPDRAGHPDPVDRARCRYCGGPLVPAGTPSWLFRESRAYCSTTHRNYYWRWIRRGRPRP